MNKTLPNSSAGQRLAQTFRLPDGRRLGYAEYGTADGVPVFLLHGTPGSRRWFAEDDPTARALGLRLIATDRPGYGLSDPKPKRTVLDYPQDIAALADWLGLEHFSVLGSSGGSAYAAACAYALPERVKAAALVAGVSQFPYGRPPEEMCRENRQAFWLSRYFPLLPRLLFAYSRRLMHRQPQKYIGLVQKQVAHLCPSDREILQQEGAHVLMQLQEAFRTSTREAATEPALLSRPWGFSPTQISVPVHIWHGTEDTLAPIGPMREMAQQIPNCTPHFIAGKGHFLDGDHRIWGGILASVGP